MKNKKDSAIIEGKIDSKLSNNFDGNIEFLSDKEKKIALKEIEKFRKEKEKKEKAKEKAKRRRQRMAAQQKKREKRREKLNLLKISVATKFGKMPYDEREALRQMLNNHVVYSCDTGNLWIKDIIKTKEGLLNNVELFNLH